MSAYAAFFLNSASHVVQLELLEIIHPSFSQTYYIVRNAVKGVRVIHEDSTSHTYDYYPVKIEYVAQAADLDQSINVSFGDLGQVLPQELDNCLTLIGGMPGMMVKPTVNYRTYRSDTLTSPLFGPYRFEANNIAFNSDGATLQCSAPRLNLNATGELYSMDRFPMLRGFL